MGYDVHITRKKDWSDQEPQISLPEWVAYIKSDPSMRLDGHAETVTPDGHSLRYNSDGLAVWTRYSGHGRNGNMAWFDFRRGDVAVKNPDEEILKKMWLIAQALHAKVQGDEGELYGKDGKPTGH